MSEILCLTVFFRASTPNLRGGIFAPKVGGYGLAGHIQLISGLQGSFLPKGGLPHACCDWAVSMSPLDMADGGGSGSFGPRG